MSDIVVMNAHPYAERFPMLSGEALDEMVVDIRDKGLQHPIVTVEYEGETVILDGLNRFRACSIAGVKPKFVPFTKVANGRDEWDFVLTENVLRRHLDTSQKALIAAESLDIYRERAEARMKAGKTLPAKAGRVGGSGEATDEAGAAFKVSGDSVQRAVKVLKLAETGTLPDGSVLEEKQLDTLRENIERARNGAGDVEDESKRVTVRGLADKYLAPPKVKEPKPSAATLVTDAADVFLDRLRAYKGSALPTRVSTKLDEVRNALDVAQGR